MKILGYELTFRKAVASGQVVPFNSDGRSFFGFIREPFTGAWQRNKELANSRTVMAFSGVYAAVSLIANDISKLDICLKEDVDQNGIWVEVAGNSPFWPVLLKPNHYQTRQQFLSQWITSKLLYGNAYLLKEREPSRGIVTSLYPLDPRLVAPIVADDGGIYYRLNRDPLSGLTDQSVLVPASEIIHDRMASFWHPLVGVSPLFACATSVVQGMSIQDNSAAFFRNMSRPSGQLTAPGRISDVLAARMKKEFEDNFQHGNLGRLMVTGEGLKYEPMVIPAADAQLIEQLRWTVEDVARAFQVPTYKLQPTGRDPAANLGALKQDYYEQALQTHVEAIECLLDEGLELPARYDVELETDELLRMDPLSRTEQWKNAVSGGWMAPNEVRYRENLPPVQGGDSPMIQQQNYSLAALDRRDSQADPFNMPNAAPPAAPAATGNDQTPAAAQQNATNEDTTFVAFLTAMDQFAEHIDKELQ